jgi:hypothetical protein
MQYITGFSYKAQFIGLPNSNYLGKNVHFMMVCCDRRLPASQEPVHRPDTSWPFFSS